MPGFCARPIQTLLESTRHHSAGGAPALQTRGPAYGLNLPQYASGSVITGASSLIVSALTFTPSSIFVPKTYGRPVTSLPPDSYAVVSGRMNLRMSCHLNEAVCGRLFVVA